MALSEHNYTAGGFTIKYEAWDDASPERGAWDPALEASNADKAIKDPEIVGFIGPYNSGAAKISMPKLNAAGLAMISPGATWPGLTKPGIGEANEPTVYRPSGKINFFRVVPADDIQGKVGAHWARDLGTKKVYIIHDKELYGKGIAGLFQKTVEALGGIEVAGVDGIDPKASNYKSLATKIRQTGADLVYIGATTQTNAAQIAKDLKNSGVRAKLMAPDGCFENAFIEGAGKDTLEGNAYITFGGVPPQQLSGKGKTFYEKYKQTYGAEPEAYAAYGYESANVLIEAIEKSKSKDRSKILAALSQTKNYDGVLGNWSFDANGDTTLTTMSGNTVKNGHFEFVKILE